MHEKQMGAWEAYKRYWKNGVTFEGRARRKEYWMPQLFHLLFSLIAAALMAIVAAVVFSMSSSPDEVGPGIVLLPLIYFGIILFSLATYIPTLAVSVRRMHDIGKSGWWVLLPIVGPFVIGSAMMILNVILLSSSSYQEIAPSPVVMILPAIMVLIMLGTSIWFLVLTVQDSQPGTNKWGMNPKDPKSPDRPMNMLTMEQERRMHEFYRQQEREERSLY
ncbi:DUF805 domain-containing protein [Macrococcus brunensis]|uniref:DUF805 domain-containing protein n=1 Tax=Macrococcus brunensis TaxID=198483 RepID=UPI001EEFEB2E|nr:DUF805 domain-containing protein [Macrococcus brunensis]ULG72380.1 DUF805 domain-containing protein [Macrococcus brunensis]